MRDPLHLTRDLPRDTPARTVRFLRALESWDREDVVRAIALVFRGLGADEMTLLVQYVFARALDIDQHDPDGAQQIVRASRRWIESIGTTNTMTRSPYV